ncbi:stalk domain-containing protein [Paenibacillus sp. 32352]|uniref:stalk domain-containing protein n=1 Tax=Paenibacillus sp. 32352 TaxID=1969111 RepID=UPI0015C486CF|nr:stalk domain-containing protein [Paenibacillus sp. 32352]
MRRSSISCKLLTGSIALALLWGGGAHPALAADTAFINQISEQYQTFEKKHRDLYDQYLQNERHLYDTYHSQMMAVYNELMRRSHADLDTMTSLIDSDIQQLKQKYKENSSEFKDYVRKADKNRAGGPMNLYKSIMDPNRAGSPMDQFEDSLDANSAGSATDQYDDTLDPNHAGSAMDTYDDEANQHSAGSVMDGFEKDSSIHSAGSIMDRYEKGKLTKSEAEQLMADALAKAEAGMNKRISETEHSVQAQKNESLRDIRDAWLNVKNSLLKQREQTIQEISEARKKLTGTGIDFEPLVLDDWITVIVDGDYLIFEQPPVIVDGSTLVPMRTIFEKLGAEVLWNSNDQSVTANRGAASVWLQINNSSARINNQSQTLELAPRMINGNTMVPLRFVSEALGCNVQWDDSKKTITITSA